MASIRIDQLVRYFIYLTIINLFAAIAFTAPVIVPELAFPLKLAVWPGTWMLVSYFVFLIVGVLGTLGWALLLDLVGRVSKEESCDKFLALGSLILVELAVYVETSFMFTAGYLGGTFILSGVGQSFVTYIIGPLVVPIGVSISLYLIGTLLGVTNIVLALSHGSSARN